jgi:hypothetical protein
MRPTRPPAHTPLAPSFHARADPSPRPHSSATHKSTGRSAQVNYSGAVCCRALAGEQAKRATPCIVASMLAGEAGDCCVPYMYSADIFVKLHTRLSRTPDALRRVLLAGRHALLCSVEVHGRAVSISLLLIGRFASFKRHSARVVALYVLKDMPRRCLFVSRCEIEMLLC